MNWLPLVIVSVQVSLVAALGLVAASFLRSAAHRHSVLFAALLCTLASPLFYAGAAATGFSVSLPTIFPWPHENARAVSRPHVSAPVQPADTLLATAESRSASPRTTIRESPVPVENTPIAPETAVLQQSESVSRSLVRLDFVVAGLWLAGSLLSLAGVVRSQLKTARILKTVRPIDAGIDSRPVAVVERRLNAVGRLRVATTGKVAGPAVVGFFQPWILIPARYLETLSSDELLQVLIHEGAHALRRDPLVALLQRIGGALFWWNPLVHLVNRDLTRAREEVCDNFVLTHTEPEIYGATLLRLATLSPAMARLALAIGIFDSRGKLEDRICGLLDTRRKKTIHVRFVTAATVFGAFALFSVVVAAARVGAQKPGDTPQDTLQIAAKDAEAAPAESIDPSPAAKPARQTAPAAALEGTVVGTVVAPDGKPVAGIEVLAFEGGRQLEQKFRTDARGEFLVPKAWREVDHWLTVVAREGRERLGWFDFMIHGHSDSGQKRDDGSFRLVLLPLNRTIRGRILDESGRPLAQIPVQIHQLEHAVNSPAVHWRYQMVGGEPLVLGAISDSDGRFELKLPAETSAWLGASHADWVTKQIRVTREMRDVADTRLVRAAKVAGRVIDSRNGKPLAGVTIGAFATRTEILESSGGDAKTDVNGNYLIQGLRSGEYTIHLLQGVHKPLTAPAHTNSRLKSGETFRADFALSVGKRLAGKVVDIDTGEPISDCMVTCCSPAHPDDERQTETNARGEFEFFVPPGQSRLDATDGRRFGNESTRTIEVSADGDPEPVVLRVGEFLQPVPGSFKIFLGPALDRKVSVEFHDTPLADALREVCSSAGMQLELDVAALTSAGYSKDTPVNLDEATPVTLKDALTLVLKPCEKLDFTVVRNQVFVSTREHVAAREKQAPDSEPATGEPKREGPKGAATSPPRGLEFLAPYPRLHSLSLDMSEEQFLEIVKKRDLKVRKSAADETIEYRIALGDGLTLIVMFRQDGTCSGIQRIRGEDKADEKIRLADLVRDFNAENKKLQRGLDQPPLTEDEVVKAIQRTEWNQWWLRGAETTWEWTPGERDRTEREFAIFKSVAQTRELPPESSLAVWTTEDSSTFIVKHIWSIRLYLPSLDGDGFDAFSIRHTRLHEEKIDPQSVAWGRPDADGLSLGVYLSPKKDTYRIGERVRLRLFVRNEGTQAVMTTWANTTHPMPLVTDAKGAKVAVRIGHDQWSEKWISGFMVGGLGPGDAHAFTVPFEISIGGDGTNKLVGRVIDARPGQTLRLQVRESNGNNRPRAANDPEPESGHVTFKIAAD